MHRIFLSLLSVALLMFVAVSILWQPADDFARELHPVWVYFILRTFLFVACPIALAFVNDKETAGAFFFCVFVAGFEVVVILALMNVFSFVESWKYFMIGLIMTWKIFATFAVINFLFKRVRKFFYNIFVEERIIVKPS